MADDINPVVIRYKYNDESDKTNYPLTEWHKVTVAKVADHFGIKTDVVWTYFSTMHGTVFSCPIGSSNWSRLHRQDVRFLTDLPGFRWIEVGGDFQIALEHKEPHVPNGTTQQEPTVQVKDFPDYDGGLLPPGKYEVNIIKSGQDNVIVTTKGSRSPLQIADIARSKWAAGETSELGTEEEEAERFVIKPCEE